jgi:hypothetical protein
MDLVSQEYIPGSSLDGHWHTLLKDWEQHSEDPWVTQYYYLETGTFQPR